MCGREARRTGASVGRSRLTRRAHLPIPIPFFGPGQNDAFIPALAWFLVATVLAAAPVVLAPMLARMRRGRALRIVAGTLAAVALVPFVLQAAQGFGALGDQRALVQRTLAVRYGLVVTDDQVASLLEGGKIIVPASGSAKPIALAEVAPGQYVPVQAGVGRIPAR
jgi:hypothetical protein